MDSPCKPQQASASGGRARGQLRGRIGTGICLAGLACCLGVAAASAQGGSAEDGTELRRQSAQLYAQGSYAEAARSAEAAVAADEKRWGTNHPNTAASLHRLAEALGALGDYAKAVPAAQRALAVRERALGAQHVDTTQSLNDLGVLYLRMGDTVQAQRSTEQALRIREKILAPDDAAIAESLNNLAEVYRRQRKYDAAQQLLKRALVIKKKTYGAEHALVATAHNNLAALYLEMGRTAKNDADREQYFRQASEHAVRAKAMMAGSDARRERPETATVLINRAWSLWTGAAVTTDQVRDLFQEALAIREKTLGSDHPDTAQALILLAAAHQRTGNFKEALALFQRALPAEDRTLANTMIIGDEEQKLAFVQQSQGHYFAALSLIQHHFRQDATAVRFALEAVLRRKGIVLDVESRVQEGIAKHLTGAALASWRRLTESRNELAQLLLGGPGGRSPDDYLQAIEQLQEAINREEGFVGARSTLVAQELAQRRVTAKAVAGHLPQDSAMIEFVRIQDWDEQRLAWSATGRYLAFVLTPDEHVTLVDLGEANTIDTEVAATLSTINDPRAFDAPVAYAQKSNAALSDLYQLVLQPLAAAIGSRHRLIISPDGELNKLPFQALRTPTGLYLVEERTVSQVTSGRDLLRGRSGIAPKTRLLLIANPAFDEKEVLPNTGSQRAARPGGLRRTFGALPGTAAEAQAIRSLVSGATKVLLGKAATEAAVRQVKSPQILHFATHGFFFPQLEQTVPDPLGRSGRGVFRGDADPLRRSGMALVGANYAYIDSCDEGIMCASEVEDLDLYGTDLVVLSACETALGEVKIGEGVYGLRRAFVLAGARDLVMSLWPVDDEVTRDLMQRFYRAYQRGESAVAALRQAQIETIASLRATSKAGKDGQPIAMVNLWAPFIVQQTGE